MRESELQTLHGPGRVMRFKMIVIPALGRLQLSSVNGLESYSICTIYLKLGDLIFQCLRNKNLMCTKVATCMHGIVDEQIQVTCGQI
jgi:hypothetical protein